MAASVADATAINPNGTKTFLANCVSIFTNGKPTFIDGLITFSPRILSFASTKKCLRFLFDLRALFLLSGFYK